MSAYLQRRFHSYLFSQACDSAFSRLPQNQYPALPKQSGRTSSLDTKVTDLRLQALNTHVTWLLSLKKNVFFTGLNVVRELVQKAKRYMYQGF